MYSFFVTILARPSGATVGSEIELAGRKFQTVTVSHDDLAATSFACDFETACQRLAALERMFVEADGAFVWVSPQGAEPWQIDGNLFDRDGKLRFVDLKGTCPSDEFDRFLTALGWPDVKLMFQLTREAVLLDEEEFRRHAA